MTTHATQLRLCGFVLVVVDDYSRGLGSGALRPIKELLVELRAAHVVA